MEQNGAKHLVDLGKELRLFAQVFPNEGAMSATSFGGFQDRLLDLLHVQYGDRRNPAKALARDARCNPKTGANWLRRVCAPRSGELLQLMASNERFAAELVALVEQERRCRAPSSSR